MLTTPASFKLLLTSLSSDKPGDKQFSTELPPVPVATAPCLLGAERSGSTSSAAARLPVYRCVNRSIASVITECRANVCATLGFTPPLTSPVMNVWPSGPTRHDPPGKSFLSRLTLLGRLRVGNPRSTGIGQVRSEHIEQRRRVGPQEQRVLPAILRVGRRNRHARLIAVQHDARPRQAPQFRRPQPGFRRQRTLFALASVSTLSSRPYARPAACPLLRDSTRNALKFQVIIILNIYRRLLLNPLGQTAPFEQRLSSSAVPEASTIGLFSVGLSSLLARRRHEFRACL
jgi:hypothetical protein